MKEFDCRRARERMSAYIDAELPVEQVRELEAHMRGCARCAQYLDRLAADDALVAEAIGAIAVPDDLWSGIREQAARRHVRLAARWRETAAVIAATAILIGLMWFAEPRGTQRPNGSGLAPHPPQHEAGGDLLVQARLRYPSESTEPSIGRIP
jgi:predicted anti-sigma-YlaC factor YlaD